MKVEINEVYVKCDICGKKIGHEGHYLAALNNVYQIKVKNVEKCKLKPYYKKDLCGDCYNKFEAAVRRELKEQEKNR